MLTASQLGIEDHLPGESKSQRHMRLMQAQRKYNREKQKLEAEALAVARAEQERAESGEMEQMRREMAKMREENEALRTSLFRSNSEPAVSEPVEVEREFQPEPDEFAPEPPEVSAAELQAEQVRAAREKIAQALPMEQPRGKRQQPIDQDDPDRAAAQLMARRLGIEQPGPPPPVTAYAVEDEDPDRMATLLAARILQEERARLDARERLRANDLEDIDQVQRGRPPIELSVWRPPAYNPMAFVDEETGKNLLKKGYCGRWVRTKILLDDKVDSMHNIREHKRWGGEIMLNEDGTPKRWETMIAMQKPIEMEAQRKIAAANPGALDSAKTVGAREVDRIAAVTDEINSGYSRRNWGAPGGVVQFQPMPGHGAHYGPADEGE